MLLFSNLVNLKIFNLKFASLYDLFYSIRFSKTQKVAETRFLGTSSPPAPKRRKKKVNLK